MTPADLLPKLSEAQRAFLLSLRPNGEWVLSKALVTQVYASFGPNSLRGFGKSGLIEGQYRDPMKHRLTPLGEQCLALLMEQQNV